MKKPIQLLKYIWTSPSNKGERVKRIFYAIAWQAYKRTYGKPIITQLDNGPNFVLDPKSGNSTGAIYTKVYEAEYIYFLRKHIVKTGDGKALLDIGGHTGLFALLISQSFSKIVAFEPAQDTYKLLSRNIALNPQLDFIPEQMGVSDREDDLEFIVTGQNSGMNKIAKTETEKFETSYIIKCTTLDSFVSKSPELPGVSCIKIDTEGHELEILRGAKKTIESNKDIIILYENSSYAEIQTLLKSYEMKSFGITKDGVILQGADMESAYNLFAVGTDHPLYSQLS